MKFTDQTTLGEIEFERQRWGISRLLVSLQPARELSLDASEPSSVTVSLLSVDDGTPYAAQGQASTLVEALQQAFDRRLERIAELASKQFGTAIKVKDEPTHEAPYQCNVPMCGDSGVCEEHRKRGAR